MTNTTTLQRPTDHHAPVGGERSRRSSRKAVRLSLAAIALSFGLAVVLTSDGTDDRPPNEWTSEDGLRWEHPDGRWYVVASPQTTTDR
jgi:hypothetical protein